MTEPSAPTRTIEVFADVVCPFTHVGLHRLFDLRDKIRPDVAIEVHAWPLELVNGEPAARDDLLEEIVALRSGVAPELFAGFDPDAFPMSTLPALALAARAYRGGVRTGEEISRALRDALFELGRDLRDPDELAAIGRGSGVDEPDAVDRAAVLVDLETGRARGVIGSPHFFVGDASFFCPTLGIERVDGRLQISFDAEGFADFMRKSLGSPASNGL